MLEFTHVGHPDQSSQVAKFKKQLLAYSYVLLETVYLLHSKFRFLDDSLRPNRVMMKKAIGEWLKAVPSKDEIERECVICYPKQDISNLIQIPEQIKPIQMNKN